LAVLKQSSHAVAKSAVLAVATDGAILNRAELTNGNPKPSSPYGAFMIFQQRDNYLSSKLRVLSQLAVLPTCQSVPGANPKRAVAGDEQFPNLTGWKMLVGWRLPGDSPDPIET